MTVLLASATALLVTAVSGCGDGPRGADVFRQPRRKTEAQREDSTRVVARATAALGLSRGHEPLRAESFTRGSEGWLIRLLPATGNDPQGGGTVWVGTDGSATVVSRY